MKAGDLIRIRGGWGELMDFEVEEFRFCLGVFKTPQHRTAGEFTPLCDLYEAGPESQRKYISNFGEYNTEYVQAWMNILELVHADY
jgi:hypothetical protein